jgi:hypothetical protein
VRIIAVAKKTDNGGLNLHVQEFEVLGGGGGMLLNGIALVETAPAELPTA